MLGHSRQRDAFLPMPTVHRDGLGTLSRPSLYLETKKGDFLAHIHSGSVVPLTYKFSGFLEHSNVESRPHPRTMPRFLQNRFGGSHLSYRTAHMLVGRSEVSAHSQSQSSSQSRWLPCLHASQMCSRSGHYLGKLSVSRYRRYHPSSLCSSGALGMNTYRTSA